MKLSLGILLACCLAGLQFLAVTVVVSSYYLSSERVLLDHARNLLSDVGSNTIEHTKGFLAPARGAAELAARLAENQIVASDEAARVEQLLFQQLRIAPQFAGLYYGDSDGNFIYVKQSDGPGSFQTKIVSRNGAQRETELVWRDSDFKQVERRADPEDEYDPRGRPWYKSAEEARGTVWTDPYIFYTSQRPGLTVAAPVVSKDGGLKGVVGVDIEIDEISRFMSELQIGESGAAVMVHANGDVIAHPNQDLLRRTNEDGTFRFVRIREIDDPVARAAFAEVKTGTSAADGETHSKFVHNGATYVATVMPSISDQLPWTIAVFAPEADFTGSIKANRTTNIGIAAVIATVTALIGVLLAHFIQRPVSAFAVRAALVSQGEIDPSTPTPKTYRELDLANETLMREISQRRQTEQAYGQTFDQASHGMVQIAPDTGRFIRVNRKFAEITGYPAAELLKMAVPDLLHPDDAVFMRSGRADPQAINGDWRCIRKTGDMVWVNVNVIMIRDEKDLPQHYVATISDISETKEAAAKIQHLNRDLSHLARGEVLSQMASGLAHELNQPLTAIVQNADTAVLTAKEASAPDSELLEILDDIEKQALRAGEVIHALRTFSKKGEEETTPFDLRALLRQSLQLVRAEATENGVRISVADNRTPTVLGIRVQVAQVIVNLVRNAIEAIAAQQSSEREVRVSTSLDGDNVKVTIEDTGPGIPEGFELFTQFETTKPNGMGLGLSICRSMIEAMGGMLWLDSDYEGGARFHFTLPKGKTESDQGSSNGTL